MARSTLVTAAKVILYVNGKPFAPIVSFNWSSSTPPREIMGLDSGQPYELAPGRTDISGNMVLLRQVGDGGLEGAGLVPFFADLPREQYFSLALVERTTDTTIFRADQCLVVSQNWDVASRGLMTGSVSFKGLIWANEAAR